MMRVKHQKCTARLYFVTILMNEKLFYSKDIRHVHYYGLLLSNSDFVYLMYIHIPLNLPSNKQHHEDY